MFSDLKCLNPTCGSTGFVPADYCLNSEYKECDYITYQCENCTCKFYYRYKDQRPFAQHVSIHGHAICFVNEFNIEYYPTDYGKVFSYSNDIKNYFKILGSITMRNFQ